MNIADRAAIVTGAASGIGAATAARFLDEGARGVVVADIDGEGARAVAARLGPRAMAMRCDVTSEGDIQELVREAQQRFGVLDIFVSNAGILGPLGGIEVDDSVWERLWRVHAMAHVWAARAAIPHMLARGEGYFWITASAAGLLNVVESAPYGVTKHAAVGLAEWLRIAYGRRGLRVSCLCPQTVRTPMIGQGGLSGDLDGLLAPEDVARAMVRTMEHEQFLCLPHPEVATYMRRKTEDYDRWLGGMQKVFTRSAAAPGGVDE